MTSISLSRVSLNAKLLLGMFLLGLAQAHFHSQVTQNPYLKTKPPEAIEDWNPEIFKILSFGYLPAAIDWLFIKCLADSVNKKIPAGTHSYLYYNLKHVVELDPYYYEPHLLAGTALVVVQQDILGAKDLLTRGNEFAHNELTKTTEEFQSRFWPDAWKIPMFLGYLSLFHLDDIHTAGSYFEQASTMKGVPDYLKSLSARLKKPGGEYETGLRLLSFMILGAKTEQAKQVLEKRKENLFIAQYFYELNQDFLTVLRANAKYRATPNPSPVQMDGFFKDFLRTRKLKLDPWGKELTLSAQGRIQSATRYSPVFGLH